MEKEREVIEKIVCEKGKELADQTSTQQVKDIKLGITNFVKKSYQKFVEEKSQDERLASQEERVFTTKIKEVLNTSQLNMDCFYGDTEKMLDLHAASYTNRM